MGLFSKLSSWLSEQNVEEATGSKRMQIRAREVFDSLCNDHNICSIVYKDSPDIKNRHWERLNATVNDIVVIADPQIMHSKLREKFADATDLAWQCSWYTNLSNEDRAIVAKHIFDSDIETQDANYWPTYAHDFALAMVLSALIDEDFAWTDDGRKSFYEARDIYRKSCEDYWAFILTLAHARNDGRETTTNEKEMGKEAMARREIYKCAFAGLDIPATQANIEFLLK